MNTSDNGAFEFFKKMAALQGALILTLAVIGTVVMVFSHQFVLGVLPANEWSPLIGWVVSAVIGYGVASALGGVIGILGFAYIFADE